MRGSAKSVPIHMKPGKILCDCLMSNDHKWRKMIQLVTILDGGILEDK